MNAQKKLVPYRGQPLSTSVLLSILQEYERPYDKLGALVKTGDLIQLRKGLYMTSTEIDEVTADPFLIANHLYGPSYVSLDSRVYSLDVSTEIILRRADFKLRLVRTLTNDFATTLRNKLLWGLDRRN